MFKTISTIVESLKPRTDGGDIQEEKVVMSRTIINLDLAVVSFASTIYRKTSLLLM